MPPAPQPTETEAASVGDLLEGLRGLGTAPALWAPGRTPLDFAGLLDQVAEVRAWLNGRGLGRGDRLATALPSGPEAAAAFLAVAASASCAPLDPASPEAEIRRHLEGLRAAALVVPEGAAPAARVAALGLGLPVLDLVPRPGAGAGRFDLAGALPAGTPRRGGAAQPEDEALVLATSGTTGGPKRVPIRQRQLLAMARHTRASAGLRADDRCLSFMPLHHLAGLVTAVLSALGAGGSLVCVPGFSPEEAFRWMAEFRPTWITAVPTVHQALADHAARHPGLAPPPLRQLRSSASALPESLLARLEALFQAPVLESYGMTETQVITANPPPPGVRKPGSVGLPAGPEVAVVDPDGRPVAPGEVGEVVVRGPNVFDGYEDAPEANAAAFRDGWFRTGDLGRLDADGYLFLRGRAKELINRGGQKVSPWEVEAVLLEHPAVAEAAVFPAPHATLGEAVMAAVRLRPGQDPGEPALRRHAAARLAPFKVPLRILPLADLPKGPTGKLRRGALAEQLRPLLEAPSMASVEDPDPEAWREAEATAAALARHPALLRCAVQPRLDAAGRRHLLAYIVPGGEVASEDLALFLLREGGGCVIPSLYVALEAMPRDAEGRVDWRRLSETPVNFNLAQPPRETVELLLARIWSGVLPGAAPTLADDFFLSGGDSLRAMDLLLRVEAELGVPLPPEAFFRDATLGALVEATLRAGSPEGAPPLLTVQAGSPARPPLFFVHGDFNGGGFHCRRLAALLGADLPFHTFHPHGLPGQPQVSTVEAMAEAYLPCLRAAQPRGPYRLAGHCNGAVVAFELARRLEAAGEAVAWVALLSPPPARVLGTAVGLPAPLPAGADLGRQALHNRRALLVAGYGHALRSYAPAPVKAPLHLLLTEEDLEGAGARMGWEAFGAPGVVLPVAGSHLGMLGDHLEDTARALRELLA
ncbi:MAG: AMP-binding protein [Holophagaceae bacterium]